MTRIVQPIRIRSLARQLGITDDDLIMWLLEHAPDVVSLEQIPHPADFIPAETAERALAELARPTTAAPAPCRLCAPDSATYEDDPSACPRCGGSTNARAAQDLIDTFAATGMRRLLIVGGGPGTSEEVVDLLGDHIDVRIVDGTTNRRRTRADADLQWCDVAVVWSSTILTHSVSARYMNPKSNRLIIVSTRGVASLCRAAAEKARRLSAR